MLLWNIHTYYNELFSIINACEALSGMTGHLVLKQQP